MSRIVSMESLRVDSLRFPLIDVGVQLVLPILFLFLLSAYLTFFALFATVAHCLPPVLPLVNRALFHYQERFFRLMNIVNRIARHSHDVR